jgi:hypothetical protein
MSQTNEERWAKYKKRHKRKSVYTMNERDKGYLKVTDLRIFALKSLSHRQKYLYFYLKSNNFSDGFRPTIETMSEMSNYPRSTLHEDLKALIEVEAVRKISCKDKSRLGPTLSPSTRNYYVVHPENEWVPRLWRKEQADYLHKRGNPAPFEDTGI